MSELIETEYGGLRGKAVGSIMWLGHWWAWSPYSKCSFRCVYCSVEAQGKSKPMITVDDIPKIFTDFVPHQGKHPLTLGTLEDAYPPEEAEHGFMRHVIPELRKLGIRFSIVTHGDLVARDIDLLLGNPMLNNIGVSIPHRDNALIKQYEPGSPTFEAKRDAVYKMYEAGLDVHVNVAPWIPGVTDVDAIAREFPADMVVNVGVLSYMKQMQDLTKHLFGRDVGSAERVFRKKYPTQSDIDALFYAEHQKVGKGTKGNLNWLQPPGISKSVVDKLT